ncbi:MAG: hypothetical protein U0172_12005 [Nitrospiraceae bacterium]
MMTLCLVSAFVPTPQTPAEDVPPQRDPWNRFLDAPRPGDSAIYANARFGFTLRYPSEWRRGEPMPDGIGITLFPPVEGSQMALSGFMNITSGSSQDGRQTLDEFVAAHHRILSTRYEQQKIPLTWEPDRNATLGKHPAKRLVFRYRDKDGHETIEHHLLSVGRNEGRGVRLKMPAGEAEQLLKQFATVLETYTPGRDQNAVSPLAPAAADKPRP